MDSLEFVQNVKKYCNLRGVKPTVACRESGVGTSFINNIEKGSAPSVEKVQMLAAYLGVTTSELLGEEKGPAPVSESKPLYPPKYDLLTPANKAIVDRLIADLAKAQQPGSTKLYVAARDGSRIETEVGGEVSLPDENSEIPE